MAGEEGMRPLVLPGAGFWAEYGWNGGGDSGGWVYTVASELV